MSSTKPLLFGFGSLAAILFMVLVMGTNDDKISENRLLLDQNNQIYYEYSFDQTQSNQPVFLLSHGLAGSMLDMKPLATKLSVYGSVLNWDRLSYGKSKAILPTPLTVEFTRKRTEALLNGLSIKRPIIYVAYSLGTVHAVHFQRQNPHLVNALVLIDPPLPAEKLRERNFYNTRLPGFIETLKRDRLFAMIGWRQLKAFVRTLIGMEEPERQAIYSLGHTEASIAEAESFPDFIDEVDYQTSFDNLPLLVFSRGMAVDRKVVKAFVGLSKNSEHIIYPDFTHSDFISLQAATSLSNDISKFLELRTN